MERPSLPFKQIRRDVSILSVARRYGFDLKESGTEGVYQGRCRLPMHTSKKSLTSFSVDTEKNHWACYSNSCKAARKGKLGGDVIDLVHHLTGRDYYDAAKQLMEDFHVGDVVVQTTAKTAPSAEAPEEKPEPQKAEAANTPLRFSGFKDVDHNHEYLRKRGIKPEIAKWFGVGFYAGRSSVIKDTHRIVIPIHNPQGELVAYVGRALTTEVENKYHFPPGFHKSQELFNLHRVGEDVETVAVVEGMFGTMKIVQAGFPNVVGLMGCTLSEAQHKLLRRFKGIILMLDPDEAGREAQAAILPRLAATHFVHAVHLPDGFQLDCRSSDDIQAVLALIFS
jgi:DNA primase